MCCDIFLKYFRDTEYEEVEDFFDPDDIEEAVKILNHSVPGLIIHFNLNGNITFSSLFLTWYSTIPEPLSTFMNEFNIVRATCDIKQIFFMGKLPREKHNIFLKLVRDNYLN